MNIAASRGILSTAWFSLTLDYVSVVKICVVAAELSPLNQIHYGRRRNLEIMSGFSFRGDCFSQKTCNICTISETMQHRTKGVLITNRKLHTRFPLVPKSTTLDDLERPLHALFQNR